MTSLNYCKLHEAIDNSGVSITVIAEKMGISRATLYNKISGSTEFSVSEIANFCKALRLTTSERDDIFFRAND